MRKINITVETSEESSTFFGGKQGFDYICFDNNGKIQCSGPLESMLKYAEKNNWAVAALIAIRFSNGRTG